MRNHEAVAVLVAYINIREKVPLPRFAVDAFMKEPAGYGAGIVP